MDNYLNNGTVLPSGLLSHSDKDMMAGFNKSYKNYPLRVGVVVASYPISDPNNHSKLSTEYDVEVIEQNENQGSTSIRYRNCMSSEGMGSIADFFEKSLRPQTVNLSRGFTNLNKQDGAIVLILCWDGMSDKGMIIGALNHPDRPTTLKNTAPYLEGEYNGVNVKVNEDGSTTLVFNGATDNQGNPIDASQGPTSISIEKNGSFQVAHDTVSFRLDRSGDATLTTKKDTNLNVSGNVNIIVQGNANVQCQDVSVKASGSANVETGADASLKIGGDCNATVSGKMKAKASIIELNGSAGSILTTATDPVVDTIFGIPTVGVPTVKAG